MLHTVQSDGQPDSHQRGTKMKILILLLILSSNVFAETICVKIDTSQMTQDEKNSRQAVIYKLIFEETGVDLFVDSKNPKMFISGDNACFINPTFDVGANLTQDIFEAKYKDLKTEVSANNEGAINKKENLIASAEAKLKNIGLTDEEFKEIIKR